MVRCRNQSLIRLCKEVCTHCCRFFLLCLFPLVLGLASVRLFFSCTTVIDPSLFDHFSHIGEMMSCKL
jgi:hypothetical protein